jgi:DNA-binding MarR family transcriptional regulator
MATVIPTERSLVGIISELRRLNRTITVPLERDLKRAGCPPLESYEVLRAIEESGDVHLRPVELQTRLAVPRNRMSRLIDRLVREGYVEREKAASDQRGHFVVITDLGRRASKEELNHSRRPYARVRPTCPRSHCIRSERPSSIVRPQPQFAKKK